MEGVTRTLFNTSPTALLCPGNAECHEDPDEEEEQEPRWRRDVSWIASAVQNAGSLARCKTHDLQSLAVWKGGAFSQRE
eukprot:4122613-Alexandrium_andersonii.AAC.1